MEGHLRGAYHCLSDMLSGFPDITWHRAADAKGESRKSRVVPMSRPSAPRGRDWCARALFGTILLLLLMAAAACGTAATDAGGTGASDHQAFLAAVDQVCARAVSAHAGHSFPVPGFDPEHPEPNQLPNVADYFARYGGLPETTTALHELTPPTADAAAWQGLLHDADLMTTNSQRQILAARARNVTTFVQTVRNSNSLMTEIDKTGARFGFTPGSACRQVFG